MNMDLDAATKEAPTLTLDPFAEAKAEIVEKKPEELVEEQAVPEMELTPEMIKSIRTLCATCLRHFVEAKAFKIALVPSADRSMDTCTVCQTRRGHDYVVMHR